MKKSILFFAAYLLLLTSCTPSWTKIQTGLLATDETTITAEDGSFVIKANVRFNTPFSCSKSLYEDGKVPITNDVFKILDKTYTGYKIKKVRIKTPYVSQELNGILMFCDFQPGGKQSLSTSSYRITIPESYVKAALGGKISCLYEYYLVGSSNLKATTWVLWMSDSPF